jgi:hypothetical protein
MTHHQTEDDRIDQFMETVREALSSDRTLSPGLTEEMVSEMRTHVLALYDAYLELNYTPTEAVTLTLAKFGSVNQAVGRRIPSKESRRAVAAMIHAIVGIVCFSVAPMMLETALTDFGFAPMIYGGLAGFLISGRAIRTLSKPKIFAIKVALGASWAYLTYGFLLVSRSAITLEECFLKGAIMAGIFLILGFVSRWSWQDSEKFAEPKPDQKKAISR